MDLRISLVLVAALSCAAQRPERDVQCGNAGDQSPECPEDESSFLQVEVSMEMRAPGGHVRTLSASSHKAKGVMAASHVMAAKTYKSLKPLHEPLVQLVQTDDELLVIDADRKSAATPRTTPQVLAVCMSVISMLTVGWLSFWYSTRLGDEMKELNLALLILSFGVCSWGMNILNKSLVEALHAPTLVTAAQMTMTVVGVVIVARHRFTGSRGEILRWSFIPFIFFGMLVSSFFTYKHLSLSLLMVIRNVTPIVTLPIESMIMPAGKRPYVTWPMILALCVILGSTFLYCEKIHVSSTGVAFALLNMILAIADRVAQRRLLTTECQGLSTESCVLMNNLLGLVPTLILAVVLHDFDDFSVQTWFASETTLLLVLSGFIGTGICYFALAVQREILATSFMVLQNFCRMAVVFVGVVVFADPIGWPYQVMGLVLSFAGALWYGRAQIEGLKEMRACEMAKETEAKKEEIATVAKKLGMTKEQVIAANKSTPR